jgi:spore coat protein CotH
MVQRVCRALPGTLIIVVVLGLAVFAETPSDPSAVFFDDSKVQSIFLVINSRDWDSLKEHFLDNTYYPCDFKWSGPNGTTTVRNIGIRSRGTGSRSSTKPGLRVDFDRYVTDQKFVGLKSFILRNQTQDASNMHERISMLLFQRLGVKVSREAFVKLYINNTYDGLYSIVESVDKTFLKNAFGEDGGDLYKYDYNPDDLPYYFEDKGTNPDTYVPHPFKPETNESNPQKQTISDFIRIVNNDSNTQFPTTVAPYVDWDNFTRHIAIENFLCDQDGFNGDYGINNFYWYRFENKTRFVWIPWDKSEAFKSGWDLAIFHNILDGPVEKRNRLSRRAMDLRDVQGMYLDRLLDVAKSVRELDAANPADTRNWMEREIQKEYDQIKDLVYADTQKPFTNEQFESDVEKLRTFASRRPGFVEGAVASWRGQ